MRSKQAECGCMLSRETDVHILSLPLTLLSFLFIFSVVAFYNNTSKHARALQRDPLRSEL